MSHTKSLISENDVEARCLGVETRSARRTRIDERNVANRAKLPRLEDNQTDKKSQLQKGSSTKSKVPVSIHETASQTNGEPKNYFQLTNEGAQANYLTFNTHISPLNIHRFKGDLLQYQNSIAHCVTAVLRMGKSIA